jgi:hydroxymethylpyrimidine/phosphomethylpyrimidine kinase
MTTPVALSIAGSDPSGGAGIQADLKTFHQFGVYGEAVITLITVQNSQGVQRIELLDPEIVEAQIRAVIADIPPHAIKIGALGNRDIAEAVARVAADYAIPLIVDPVMIAKHGSPLGDPLAIAPLLPHALLVTPNLDEASAICGFPVTDLESMKRAAQAIANLGAANVLVKGGHLPGDAVDLLLTGNNEFHEFATPRIDTGHTHGTGCALSAAITAELAKGTAFVEAIRLAKAFVTQAIRSNPGLGAGSGPLDFFAR